MIDPQRNLVKV